MRSHTYLCGDEKAGEREMRLFPMRNHACLCIDARKRGKINKGFARETPSICAWEMRK